MGTRGLTVVIQDGTHKVAQYGQWDHYPTGQGADAVAILQTDDAIENIRKALTRFVSQEEHQALYDEVLPEAAGSDWLTPEQANKFNAAHPQFSRDNGAKILGLVADAGAAGTTLALSDQIEFAKDSLFCEWAYVVDLDQNRFEIYKGFQQEPHTEGRFASYEQDRGYFPVRLIKSYPLDALPSKDDLAAVEKEAYPDDED